VGVGWGWGDVGRKERVLWGVGGGGMGRKERVGCGGKGGGLHSVKEV
jgi:hypothetical protein